MLRRLLLEIVPEIAIAEKISNKEARALNNKFNLFALMHFSDCFRINARLNSFHLILF